MTNNLLKYIKHYRISLSELQITQKKATWWKRHQNHSWFQNKSSSVQMVQSGLTCASVRGGRGAAGEKEDKKLCWRCWHEHEGKSFLLFNAEVPNRWPLSLVTLNTSQWVIMLWEITEMMKVLCLWAKHPVDLAKDIAYVNITIFMQFFAN